MYNWYNLWLQSKYSYKPEYGFHGSTSNVQSAICLTMSKFIGDTADRMKPAEQWPEAHIIQNEGVINSHRLTHPFKHYQWISAWDKKTNVNTCIIYEKWHKTLILYKKVIQSQSYSQTRTYGNTDFSSIVWHTFVCILSLCL